MNTAKKDNRLYTFLSLSCLTFIHLLHTICVISILCAVLCCISLTDFQVQVPPWSFSFVGGFRFAKTADPFSVVDGHSGYILIFDFLRIPLYTYFWFGLLMFPCSVCRIIAIYLPIHVCVILSFRFQVPRLYLSQAFITIKKPSALLMDSGKPPAGMRRFHGSDQITCNDFDTLPWSSCNAAAPFTQVEMVAHWFVLYIIYRGCDTPFIPTFIRSINICRPLTWFDSTNAIWCSMSIKIGHVTVTGDAYTNKPKSSSGYSAWNNKRILDQNALNILGLWLLSIVAFIVHR